MELSPDIGSDEQAFLDLEYRASEPYTTFVFASTDQALNIRRHLFARGLCEFSPPYGQLLRETGRPLGMLAVLTGAELSACRLRAAVALSRAGFLREDAGLAMRIRLAGRVLLKLLPTDFYISRIAVHEGERSRGIGAFLVRQAEEDAVARGCPRIALEVSPSSIVALHLYVRQGYEQIDDREVTDPATGRSLRYLHLTKTLE